MLLQSLALLMLNIVCRGLVHSTASMPAMPGTPQSPPQSGASASSQQQSRQHERSQEQASSLFGYAWSQVFETPGLPSALRLVDQLGTLE